MPRKGGTTQRRGRHKHQGHRMHRKTRAARRLAKTSPTRDRGIAWGRSAA